jgi:hypothetical protein
MSVSFNQIRKIAIGCIILFTIACRRKAAPDNVPAELKKAMLSYLEKQPNYDSTRVRFEVRDVYFYNDTALYRCQFKVRMIIPSKGIDTIGMMTGTVSKDFSVVHRND